MKSLLLKEIRSFLNSLTGYLVVAVFLLITASFLWLFKGSFNILDGAYAGLDNLFLIAPWVFMFLIPAITMRMFSDEKRTGTMEWLLTKPVSDWGIVWAKFLAGMALVLFALLPTLLYVYTVYELGNPQGNLDMAGTAGSYIGLFLLAASYVAIGLFGSAVTDNPIVSFILGMFLCFFFYFGLDELGSYALFGPLDAFILQLGINEHYTSLSRGVIDSRDALYFITLSLVFLLGARLILQSRKWE